MDQLSDLLDHKAKDLFDDDVTLSFDQGTPTTVPDTSVDSTPQLEEVEKKPTSIDTQKIKTMIRSMKDQLDAVLRALDGHTMPLSDTQNGSTVLETGESIIEGVFTGDKMLGQDGKEYSIPPNYASKSKLVEGDIMKLTIANSGKFIYKQIKPAEQIRVTGELVAGEHGQWTVVANGKPYKVLTASVTFYKGTPGDDVIILIPKDGDGTWGAVEHIIHKA